VGLDPAVRLYHVAGAQHLFAPPADQGICRYPLNRLDYTPLMRALLGRLDAWIARSETPPPSVYPRIADGTLVPRSVYAERFPGIPGVQVPSAPYAPLRLDLGPRWLTEGIADLLPPRAGPPYAVLVPAVDADGNELPGIRLPQIAVPLATCVGWNARAPEFGAPGAMARWIGSQWPFPITPADRARARDPRASILERYPTRADYARRIEAAARDLQRRGLLLQEDVEGMVEAANRRDEWQRAATQPRP
jgi:hypothetical protein